MFAAILSLFTSKDPRKYWLHTLILLGIILFSVTLYNKQNLSPYYEGFTQDTKFIMKENGEIYDDFYVKIYDTLMSPKPRSDYEITNIVKMTAPSEKSAILEIGSGTGDLVSGLYDNGYNVSGLELSMAMINQSVAKYPDITVKQGNAMDPMLYEKGSFTHILCMGMTIYQFDKKIEFFRNCFSWLQPKGYLVLHLVDRNKFDTIVPGGKPALLKTPQKYAKDRITETIIDFIDFDYTADYQFKDESKTAIFKETFTDGLTKNVRKNEMTLYMEDISDILKMAAYCGFHLKQKKDMSDYNNMENEYIFVFEKVR